MKIVKNRKIYFSISIIILIIGIIAALINGSSGNGILNFDVQFVGGTSIEANLGQQFDNDEIAALVKDVTGDTSVSVQKTGDGTSVIIKTRYLSDTINDSANLSSSGDNEAAEIQSETSSLSAEESDIEAEEISEEASEILENENTADEIIEDEITEDESVSQEITLADAQEALPDDTSSSDTKSAIINALVEKYSIQDPQQSISINEVSATISTEMWQTALLAVFVACIAMLIYITVRFRDLKTGTSVVVALVHDVLIVLAFYAIVRVPVNSTFIAAILTVLGYSVNASIVIFDRIRENKGRYASKTRENIVDISINQSVTRSLFTSLTTLFTIASLYIFGVQSVKEFALPIIVGIICGTYSSVFMAGSLWFTLSGEKLSLVENDEGEDTDGSGNMDSNTQTPVSSNKISPNKSKKRRKRPRKQ